MPIRILVGFLLSVVAITGCADANSSNSAGENAGPDVRTQQRAEPNNDPAAPQPSDSDAASDADSALDDTPDADAALDAGSALDDAPDAGSALDADSASDAGSALDDAPAPADTPAPEVTATLHPLSDPEMALPPAPIGFEALFEDQVTVRRPVSLVIEDIDVDGAVVVPVGVNAEDSSLEVPPADQVGWYRFGVAPGEPGAAVLAAHIAYDGVDGVFRRLEQVEIGASVVVGFDDGSTLRYRIDDLQEYDKDELPDSLWERDGDQRLVLITCGGDFNPQLRSYESNTVAIATPLDG